MTVSDSGTGNRMPATYGRTQAAITTCETTIESSTERLDLLLEHRKTFSIEKRKAEALRRRQESDREMEELGISE